MTGLKIETLYRQALAYVKNLEQSYSVNYIPIPLWQIAKPLGIHNIRFMPLLSTAGLQKANSGYTILVNTEAPGANQKAYTILNVTEQDWKDLPKPIRFTVAHEIAHVIFYKVAGSDDAAVFNKHAKSLEKYCSEIARIILIPKHRLLKEINDQLYDMERLSEIIQLFNVSPEVFVRRLQLPDIYAKFESLQGYIAFVQDISGRISIKAHIAWGAHALHNFKLLAEQREKKNGKLVPIGDIIKLPRFEARLQAEEIIKEAVQIPYGSGMVLPCDLSVYRINKTYAAWLIGLQVTNAPIIL